MLYCKNFDINNPNDSMALAFRFVSKGAKVLDVGCATGDLAAALKEHKSCTICGFENNPESIARCKKRECFERLHCLDLNELQDEPLSHYQNRFDVIICGDVLEHLVDPLATLKRLKGFLRKGGEFIISIPNVAHGSIKANLLLNDFSYTELGILDKTHLRFFTYRGIASLLAQSGLKIADAKAVTMPLDGYQPHTLSELPEAVRTFIEQDKHSHIVQYVMRCYLSELRPEQKNLQVLEALGVARPRRLPILFWVKRFIVRRAIWCLKFIEKIR